MSAQGPQALKKIYGDALALQKQGKDGEALQLYQKIASVNPKIAEVRFQVARLFLRNDRLDEALVQVRIAVTLKPAEPDIWKLFAEIIRTLSDAAAAREFTSAVARAPLDKRMKGDLKTEVAFTRKSEIGIGAVPEAVFQSMANTLVAGRFEEARKAALSALKRFPNTAALYDLLALAHAGVGENEASEAASKKAIALAPGFGEAHSNYAKLLLALGRHVEAVRHCNNALRFAPGLLNALIYRGLSYRELHMPRAAQSDFERAIDADPKDERAYLHLAKFHNDRDDPIAAEKTLHRALKRIKPTAELLAAFGRSLAALNRVDEAIDAFKKAIAIDSKGWSGLVGLADLLQSLGRFDEAEPYFREAIARDPNRGDIYRLMLLGRKIELDDPLVDEIKTRFNDPSVPTEMRARFGFAMSNVLESHKVYDEVFNYLGPANALMHEAYPFDAKVRQAQIDRLIESYRTIDWSEPLGKDRPDLSPVFVTGLPRSGTTLVEQIIASHSSVTGAGELGRIAFLSQDLIAPNRNIPKPVSSITTDEMDAVVESYRAHVQTLHPEAKIFTDKTIPVYEYLGFIKRMIPNAKFVVVRRDPRDNLLSMYRNVFSPGGHLYTYDMSDLAATYRIFLQLIDFWREVAPDWFYEVRYEDLVSNPEVEAPRLIEACGLEWEDACLEFHKSKRQVRTLSVHQVRQPMYKTSTRAWERYGDALDPLMEALGPEILDALD
ncbi:MAG: sulfotransferase [Alphaproteobacteria bacterium]|nr:sulfotransferase [Alphaproteobacteria bacterium]